MYSAYLLGLLAMIKCSICSYQCDNWYVSNWRLACHINFCLGRCSLELAQGPLRVALALHLARRSTPFGVTTFFLLINSIVTTDMATLKHLGGWIFHILATLKHLGGWKQVGKNRCFRKWWYLWLLSQICLDVWWIMQHVGMLCRSSVICVQGYAYMYMHTFSMSVPYTNISDKMF